MATHISVFCLALNLVLSKSPQCSIPVGSILNSGVVGGVMGVIETFAMFIIVPVEFMA